jgi:uncharacterized protein (DUF924 family)
LDEAIRTRFGPTLEVAARCELFAWRTTPHAFAQDPLALALAQELVASGQDRSLALELRHQAISTRFGRYPHRNAILGRTSGAEELAFLAEPGSAF